MWQMNAGSDVAQSTFSEPGAWFASGVAAARAGDLQAAIGRVQRAVALAPDKPAYRAELARLYSLVHMNREAAELAEGVLAMRPGDHDTLLALGVVFHRVKSMASAREAFRMLAAVSPGDAKARYNHAMALIPFGEFEAAAGELDACIGLRPDYWPAYLQRSQLATQTPGANHVAELRALLHDHTDIPGARVFLGMALAKEFEDTAEFGAAFVQLSAAKGEARKQRPYSFYDDARIFATIREACSTGDEGCAGFANDEPIFVVGMPRTGTTLVERILSRHSQVQSAGELQDFMVALRHFSGSKVNRILDPATFGRWKGIDWQGLGRAYIERARPATGRYRRFVDKLPHNFLGIGWIAQALPRARIVCVRRHPLDTCLSNFRQLFTAEGRHSFYDYSFDLIDTGKYYLEFDRLMAFWHARFPGRILDLHYEDIVLQGEQPVRRMLEFCNLEWEAQCMQAHANPDAIATASAVEARRPVNADSIGRWKAYREDLGGLISLLAANGVDVDAT